MRGSGNTEGGWDKFFIGMLLIGLAVWFLLDSVRVSSAGMGFISGTMCRAWGQHANGYMETTSMGLIFLPLFIGIVALAYDASMKWARWVTGGGVVIIIIEILSRIRFFMNMKTSHLVLLIALGAIGLGLIFASYRGNKEKKEEGSIYDK
jgi:hypothetical protein